jgi:hypothetical protein
MSYVFVVGFERCGTQAMAKIIHSSLKGSGFVVHENTPHLCEEACLYMQRRDWETPDLKERVDRYRAISNLGVVAESNHRLGFFAKYLDARLPDSKFILMVRNPVDTLVSRVATLAHWPEVLDRYPRFYQERVAWAVQPGKEDFNTYRPKPPEWNLSLHDLYLWEWLATYAEVVKQVSELHTLIVETEGIVNCAAKVAEFIGHSKIDVVKAKEASQEKVASIHTDVNAGQVIQFAQDLILPHKQYIVDRIGNRFPNDPIVSRILSRVK